MNKALLIFAFSMILNGLNAQIPNSGFEDWDDQFLYEEPVGYVSSNFLSVVFTTKSNVSKVDGVNGTNAVRLESVNSLAGPMVGVLANNKFGQGASGGTPYTSTPDTFSGYIRYDLEVGDTAGIILQFKNSGQVVSTVQFFVGGTNLNWTAFDVEIPPFKIQPDTLLFFAASSSVAVFPGSFIELDELKFNVPEQLENSSFDNWREARYVEPEGWTSVNLLAAINNDSLSVTPSDDALEGNFAARIESVWSFSSEDTTGILYTNDQINEEQGFPISGKPAALRGFYKYAPVVPDDIAIAAIELQFINISSQQREDTVVFIALREAADYTQFDIDLTGLNIPTPDTATIFFLSTNTFQQGRLGSVLLVDKLDLIPFTDVTKINVVETIHINPNPATDWINIDFTDNDGTYVIHNSGGKIFLSGTMDNINGRINVSNLPQGAYVLSIRGEKIAIGNFIKVQ